MFHRYFPAIGLVWVLAFGSASQSQAAPVATVNFAHPQVVGNAVGFMHGGEPLLSDPVAAAFRVRSAGLSPGIWRGVPREWSLHLADVQLLGARPVFVLSDLWGLPGHWPAVWPFDNLPAYSAWVRRRAAEFGRMIPSGPIWVDIWNEPDTARYWPLARDPHLDRYKVTFLAAEQALRAELGSRVRVLGPSTAGKSSMWTSRLIAFCAAHHCHLDGVAWHIAGGGSRAMSGLARSLHRAHELAAHNGSWRAVLSGKRQFFVTEYTPVAQRFLPGALLSYWAQLERGGAEQAAFAVWGHGRPEDGLLDALLDIWGQPRSTWWASRIYAVGRPARVASATSSPLWPVLGTRHGSYDKREVLLGSWGLRAGRVLLRMRGLPPRRRLRLRLAVLRPVRGLWEAGLTWPRRRTASLLKVDKHGSASRYIFVPGGSVVDILVG
ncbi:MAG: hypothetical protein F2799_05605 [Actinobacteria bacterium]|uniref:Unannotated protein n=1 Tax=freshwater metagenome TaxID=449393 RepID=A0A6J7E6I3_9ZZZZ|nr:hypothetical protein [Actinomycetota bacterium]